MYTTTILLVFTSAFFTGMFLGGLLIFRYRFMPAVRALRELLDITKDHINKLRDVIETIGDDEDNGPVKSPIQFTKQK